LHQSFLRLPLAQVFDRGLDLRIHISENLGDAVVHLVGDVQPLLGDRKIGDLAMQMGVVDGDGGLHGEALQRLFVA